MQSDATGPGKATRAARNVMKALETTCLVLFLAQLPTWLVVGLWLWRRQERAARRGDVPTCACCGYDLRATPDRCPECGAPA